MTKISELDPIIPGFSPSLTIMPVVFNGKTWSMRVSDFTVAIDGGTFLPMTGGHLSGPLWLYADPTSPLEAVTLQYLEAQLAASGGGNFLPLTGGTLTGPLTIRHPTDANIYVEGTGTSWPGIKWNTTQDGTATGYFEAARKGKTRWAVEFGSTDAETPGTQQGTGYYIRPFNDDGSAQPIIFGIRRTRMTWIDSQLIIGLNFTQANAHNGLTITPGATATNAVTLQTNGTGGISALSSLYLKGNPTLPLEAVPMQWVTANFAPLSGGGYVQKTGDQMSGGLSFGQRVVPDGNPLNLTHHLALFDGWGGISVTSGSLNFVAGGKMFMSSSGNDIYIGATTNLQLSHDPVGALEAVTLQYLQANTISPSVGDTRWVNVTGDTMSGALTIGAGVNNALTITPGATGADTITLAQSGTVGIRLPTIRVTAASAPLVVTDTAELPSIGAGGGALIRFLGSAASNVSLTFDAFGSGGAGGTAFFTGRGAQGSASAPSAMLANGTLVMLRGQGFGATSYGTGATIAMQAAQAWTDAARGAYITFNTVGLGTNAVTERLRIDASGIVMIGQTVASGAAVLQVTGGLSLTDGDATLFRDPTAPLHAVPLQYLTNNFLTTAQGDARWVNATGDTMTGQLTISTPDAAGSKLLLAGTTNGVRFTSQPGYFSFEGVDNTGVATYQPLYFGGSALTFGPPSNFQSAVTLGQDPSAPMHAVPLQYLSNNYLTTAQGDARWVNVTGDTMSGALTIGAGASNALTITPGGGAASPVVLGMNGTGPLVAYVTKQTAPLMVHDRDNLTYGIPVITPQPNTVLHLQGQLNDNVRLQLNAHGGAPVINGIATNGFVGGVVNPTGANRNLIVLGGGGYDGTAYFGGQVQMIGTATELWTPIARGTRLVFTTTANGTIAAVERMRIADAGTVLVSYGLSFGSVATGIGDFSKHIWLHEAAGYGIGVSNARMNFNVNGGAFVFMINLADTVVINGAGISMAAHTDVTLGRLPTQPMHAATMGYADTKLALTGGTVTGYTWFDQGLKAGTPASGQIFITIDQGPGAGSGLNLASGGYARWLFAMDHYLESGGPSNAGDGGVGLAIYGYYNDGGFKGQALGIARETFHVTLTETMTVGRDPVAALEVATMRYVDNILVKAGGPFLPLSAGSEHALTGQLYLPHVTPTVAEMATAKFYVDAADQNLQAQISAVASGSLVFYGQLDVANDVVHYKYTINLPDSTMPPPNSVPKGGYIIVTSGGVPPTGTGTNIPPMPPGTPQYVRGDWFISDGEIWVFLPTGLVYFTADAVEVTPPIEGTVNVQDTLQWLHDNKVNKAGDTMAGGLSFGQQAMVNPSDLSRHISLFDGFGGFTVTDQRLNIVTAGGSIRHVVGGVDIGWFDTLGLHMGLAEDVLLSRNPIADLAAVPKQYVDAAFSGYLKLTGGSMLGPLNTWSNDGIWPLSVSGNVNGAIPANTFGFFMGFNASGGRCEGSFTNGYQSTAPGGFQWNQAISPSSVKEIAYLNKDSDFYVCTINLQDWNRSGVPSITFHQNMSAQPPIKNYGGAIGYGGSGQGDVSFYNTNDSSGDATTSGFAWYQATAAAGPTSLMQLGKTGNLNVIGGISTNNNVVTLGHDLTKHINLYGNSYGFSVTGFTLNLVSAQVIALLTEQIERARFTAIGLTMGAATDIILNRDPSQDMHAVNRRFLDARVAGFLPLTGGNMTGNILMTGQTRVNFFNGSGFIGNEGYDRADIFGVNLGLGSWHGLGFTTTCGGQNIPTGMYGIAFSTRDGALELSGQLSVKDGRQYVGTQIQTMMIWRDPTRQIIELNGGCMAPSIAGIVNAGVNVAVNDRLYDDHGNTYTVMAATVGGVSELRMDNARASLNGATANPVALHATNGSIASGVTINLTWTVPTQLLFQHTAGQVVAYGATGIILDGGSGGTSINTSPLYVNTGINFNGGVSLGGPQDLSRGITLWGSTNNGYGFVVTNATLNYNVVGSASRHAFYADTALLFAITGGDHVHSYIPLQANNYVQVNSTPGQAAQLVMNAGAGGGNNLSAYLNGSPRWIVNMGNSTSETGGNAGSTFVINAYDDAGQFLGQPLYITRGPGGGDTAITGYLYVAKDPWQPTSAVTLRYLQANYSTNADGDARWVNVGGDTMSGALTVNANVTITGSLLDVYNNTRFGGNSSPADAAGISTWGGIITNNISQGAGETDFVNLYYPYGGFRFFQKTSDTDTMLRWLLTMEPDGMLRLSSSVIYNNLPGGGNAIGFTWAADGLHPFVDGNDQGAYAPKSWVTNNFAPSVGGGYVAKSGDTMSGMLTINGYTPPWGGFNYASQLVIRGVQNNGIGIFDSSDANGIGIHNGGGALCFSGMPLLGDSVTTPAEWVRFAPAAALFSTPVRIDYTPTDTTAQLWIRPKNGNAGTGTIRFGATFGVGIPDTGPRYVASLRSGLTGGWATEYLDVWLNNGGTNDASSDANQVLSTRFTRLGVDFKGYTWATGNVRGGSVTSDNGQFIMANNPAYFFERNSGSGDWRFVEGNTTIFKVDQGGNATIPGSATVNGQAWFRGANPQINIDGAAGTWRTIQFYSGAAPRWNVQIEPSAEPGDNSGSDFLFTRWLDNGTPQQIARFTRQGGRFLVSGAASNDLIQQTVPQGNWARYFSTVTDIRTWGAGTRGDDGAYVISDENAQAIRFAIGVDGASNVYGALNVQNRANLHGIYMNNHVSASATDLAGGIDMYGGSYGFSITGGTLNIISGGATNFYPNGLQVASMNSGGLTFMSGLTVTLGRDPTAPFEAATRQYVDAKVATGGNYVAKTGDVMTGPLGMGVAVPAAAKPSTIQTEMLVLPWANGGIGANVYVDNVGGGAWKALAAGAGWMMINGATDTWQLSTWNTSTAGATVTGVGRLTFDGRGNLALGILAPQAHALGNGGNGGWLFGWGVTANNWAQNAYYDGTNWRFMANGYASQAQQSGGGFQWQSAGATAGTKDGVASMITRMMIDPAGNLTAYGNTTTTSLWVNGYLLQADSLLNFNSAAGKSRYIMAMSSSSLRWQLMIANNEAETGGNAGSNFSLSRFDDNQNYLGTPLSISRATGNVTISQTLVVNSRATVNEEMNVSGIWRVNGVEGRYMHCSSADAYWRWYESSQLNMQLGTDGTLRLFGSMFCRNGSSGIFTGGSGVVIQASPSWYWDWNSTYGHLAWVTPNGTIMTLAADRNVTLESGLFVNGGAIVCQSNCIGIRYISGAYATSSHFLFGWSNVVGSLATVSVDNGGAAYAVANASDARLKHNIGVSKFDCLDAISNLSLVEFDWLQVDDPWQLKKARAMPRTSVVSRHKVRVGLIAQEVAKILPEAVHEGDDFEDRLGRVWGLDNNVMEAVVVGAIQQLAAQNTALAARNEELEARIRALETRRRRN